MRKADYEEQLVPASEQDSNNSYSLLGPYDRPLLDGYFPDTLMPTSTAAVSFPATVRHPSLEVFAGPFEFKIGLSSNFAWHYSELLNKVFMKLGEPICLDITLTGEWTDNHLFIRALPVYLSGELEEIVRTCPEHKNVTHPLNRDFSAVDHVIRTTNPCAEYQTDAESGRHSVVTLLQAPQPGASSIPLMYTFVCRHSCSGGIARRQLAVVFTLETSTGHILGRQLLDVRVCSCPARDKKKQEEAFLRNNSSEQTQDIVLDTKSLIKEMQLQEEELHSEHVLHSRGVDLIQESPSNPSETNHGSINMQEQLLAVKVELPVLPKYITEIKRQALALLALDICENNRTQLTELDVELREIYRGNS